MALCNYSCDSLCGINTSCVSQTPATEMIVQPAPFKITIPGAVMTASPEPAAVVANSPCATGGYYEPCYGGWGGYGYGYGSRKWGSRSVCSSPYSCSPYRGCN